MVLLYLLWVKLCLLHPFHVSVCDVVYDSRDKHLKISVRIFIDDLEFAFQKATGDLNLDITKAKNKEQISSLLELYLANHLQIEIKNQKVDLKYLGFQFESDAVWAYLENEDLEPFDQVNVKYSVLFESFADQENLVHIRKNGKVKSARLSNEQESATLSWN